VTRLLTAAASELDAHVNDGGVCAVCGAFPCQRAMLAEFTLGAIAPATASGALARSYRRSFPGTADQVRAARRFAAGLLDSCPAAEDIVLCVSELATNTVRHSASGRQGGTFAVSIVIIDGLAVILWVRDRGGLWKDHGDHHERMHGLGIVRSLAADVRIDGDPGTGRIVTAWFSWDSSAVTSRNTT
jgi:serine/threonine-protein kinase RsbW